MMELPLLDAVIVGAGPAGAAAAILLARGGWSVALVERQRFPRRKVCGECIAASNLPLLDTLGVGGALAERAGPALTRVALWQRARAVDADLPAAAHAAHPWGRALGRETLDMLLLAQAQREGVRILQPWSLQAIEGTAGDWHCSLRAVDTGDTMRVSARVAIAAHGSWEAHSSWDDNPRVREAQTRVRRSSQLLAFKANFLDVTLPGGTLPILSMNGGYGGMVIADGGVATIACCVRRDRLDTLRRAAPGERAGAVIEAWLRRECSGTGRALQGAVRAGPWLSAGPVAPGVRLRGDDQVFRIGNAAGEAHPIVGEGISMALQSAALLCGHLLRDAGGTAAPGAQWQRAAGYRYCLEWRRHFVPRLRLAALFAHLAMRPVLSMPL